MIIVCRHLRNRWCRSARLVPSSGSLIRCVLAAAGNDSPAACSDYCTRTRTWAGRLHPFDLLYRLGRRPCSDRSAHSFSHRAKRNEWVQRVTALQWQNGIWVCLSSLALPRAWVCPAFQLRCTLHSLPPDRSQASSTRCKPGLAFQQICLI